MSTLETEPPPRVAPAASRPAAPEPRSPRRKRSWLGRVLALLVLGVGAGAAYYYVSDGGKKPIAPRITLSAVLDLFHSKSKAAQPASKSEVKSGNHWDGRVKIDDDQAKAVGLGAVKVEAQVEPIKLELTGRTAYDPNSLNKVRPRFDTLVSKVYAELGQLVHKGDPLVEMDSVDLAAAKNDLQAKYVQWRRDLRVLKLHEKLASEGAVSLQTKIDDQNAESKSRLDFNTTRDKLQILGVPIADIEPLIKDLGDLPANEAVFGTITDKARMTLRSRVDGIVIQREVVPGNYYDDMDILMVIAPLDHLWVFANVYEVDQARVAVGQRMDIVFPFLQQTLRGTIEYVSSEVSRETRAVQVRASIRNPGGKLKSDMLVKVFLEIPPVKGMTVIPRLAMVVLNGSEYVFVKTGSAGSAGTSQYARRKVTIAQEKSDQVVIASGLEAGETVATSGSLVLAQLYEDLQMVETGMPLQ
ncbi:MAG: efflux RND transporter periplasmic adaptor subunit [Isosphaeraceae bacterium]